MNGVFLIISCCLATALAQKGIYWRDYDGELPRDALAGGKGEGGRQVYIGKALNVGYKMICGTLREGSAELFYEFDHKGWRTSRDVLILCADKKNNYQWVKVNTGDELSKATESGGTLVPGGTDYEVALIVGRYLTSSGYMIGKVRVYDSKFGTLYYGNGFQVRDFEVLVYDDVIH